ncbi:hypothetical protein GGR61_001622 [Xanthomonas arboricola]|nr:hypothetical protein [Xanthomonas sp. 3058]
MTHGIHQCIGDNVTRIETVQSQHACEVEFQVVPPVAQGRQLHCHKIQLRQQRARKATCTHPLPQLGGRGGNHPADAIAVGCGAVDLCQPNALRHLALQRCIQLVDILQKQRSACGALEPRGRIFGRIGAIDRDERPIAQWPVRVQHERHRIRLGAEFAAQECWEAGMRNALDEFVKLPYGITNAGDR